MNPLFEDTPLRGTMGANPVLMGKQDLDLLRMLVEGYGQQQGKGYLMKALDALTPKAKPLAPVSLPMSLGIRG
jgi:hypothetical protein